MKYFAALFSLASIFALVIYLSGFEPRISEEPWSPSQLLAPGDLAKTINDPKVKQPMVFSVGPGALIKGSYDMGPAKDKENLNKFKKALSKLSKDANIVIYCGCCPFDHCPNIRPAFALLNEMKFTNQKLLNIEHNIKMDWVNMGFPVKQEKE
jgi:thiosulfate/3-mercaptopyruvate sulfurtransferase